MSQPNAAVALASELGVSAVYAKDESMRFGLPAFKVLGASWALASVLAQRWGVAPSDVAALRELAKAEPGLEVFAATDGNHGRAAAHTAALLGIPAHIFVPSTVEAWSVAAIKSEGCKVTQIAGDYDQAIEAAAHASLAAGERDGRPLGVLIQDMSWEGYEDVPLRITQGYMTILSEVDAELGRQPSAVIVPVGVGSLAHAVVQWYAPASAPAPSGVRILSAEPDAAPCLATSLAAGAATSVSTRFTIMPGLNCGTVNPQAWPDLERTIRPADALIVTDGECRAAVDRLHALGVRAGPCGAAALAAARKAQWAGDEVLLLICTEGAQDAAAA